MTNPKPPSNGPPPSMVVGDHYRVWSLTGQGFLTFIPTDGAKKEKNADCSGTGKETSREITATKKVVPGIRGFLLEFQEDGDKYLLEPNADYTSVSKKLSSGANQDQARFYFTDLGVGSPFKALVTVEQNGKKCLASNSAKKLSLKTYNQDTPHPDTLFLITEV